MEVSSPKVKVAHTKYRPDIDGLRAIAIVPVILFHAFRDQVGGGFIGVDIFFVISGFLISSILLSGLEKNQFSVVQFYIKRVRRIFPALITVMLASIFLAWFTLFSDELERFGRHLTSGIAFISNFVFWRESGYFDSVSETKPLLHFWSLAIEEQFYLFWPLLLAFLWKSRLGILKPIIVIALASFVLNIAFLTNHPVAAFFLPVTRVWELIAGGLLAYITLYRQPLLNQYQNLQSLFGFLLLLAGFVFIREGYGFPGWWALLPVFGTFFIISAGPNAWLNQKLLSNKVMVWIGQLSYPMYLWHWPLLSFLYIIGNGHISNTQLAGAIVLTVVLSWLTYQLIEKPIRFGRYKAKAIPIMLVTMVGLLVLGLFIQFGKIAPRNDSDALKRSIEARNDTVNYGNHFVKTQFNQEKFYYSTNKTPNTTVLIGDSHALQYVPRINHLLNSQPEKLNTIQLAIHEGCLPIPGMLQKGGDFNESACNNYRSSLVELLNNPEISTIVLTGCWNCYLIQHKAQHANQMETNIYAQEPLKSQMLDSLKTFLLEASKNKNVYLLLDNPVGDDFDPSHYLQGNRVSGFSVREMASRSALPMPQQSLRAELLAVAAQANVSVIDPVDYLCNTHGCANLDEKGAPVYKDTNHLRASYAREHATYIDHAFLNAASGMN